MQSLLPVQPTQRCPKRSLKCLCPEPPLCSLRDKLPPLLSIQARALTLPVGWQTCIGWSFVNRRQTCATAHHPSFPLLSASSPPLCFDLSIRTGDLQLTTVATPPLLPPNLLTLYSPVIHEVVIKAIVLHQRKRRGGGTGVRDIEGVGEGGNRYEERPKRGEREAVIIQAKKINSDEKCYIK